LLVASVAATMVAHEQQLKVDLGPLTFDCGIALALVVALALVAVRLALQLINAVMPAKISADVQARLRTDLFDAFTRASWSVQSEEGECHLQELMTNQIMMATQIVIQIVNALSGSMMFLALVVAALSLNAVVALTVLGTAALLFIVLRPLARSGARAGRDLSHTSIDAAAVVSECVRLAEEAQVFGVGAGQRMLVNAQIESARRAFFRFVLTGGIVQSVYQSLVIVLILGGLTGIYVIGAGDIASLGAVVLMLVRASSYAQQFQSGYQSIRQVLPYLDRLKATVQRYEESSPPAGTEPLTKVEVLALDNVTFSYRGDRPVLRGISFEVRAGEAVGIVGASGAGKSTLAQLLLRLRSPESGTYLINGLPANSLRSEDWHRRVAYVSQEPLIMRASVADNIRFFRDLDRSAIARAARLAHIDEEILRLPAGYETIIGQRADAVSGGQRQRICIARALAGDPDVVVLDEPTSALDMESEAAVGESLAELQGRVTLFVIAHRVSTLNRCDRVMVLADGVVQDFAPIEELEKSSVYYRTSAHLARGVA